MRTITGTCDSDEEAEAIKRRLEDIGVAPERIAFRKLEPASGATDPAGDRSDPATGAIFVSAKVMPAQVASATEILKERKTPASVQAADEAGGNEAVEDREPEVVVIDEEMDSSTDVPPDDPPFFKTSGQSRQTSDGDLRDDSEEAADQAIFFKRMARLALLVLLAAAIGFGGGYLLGPLVNG